MDQRSVSGRLRCRLAALRDLLPARAPCKTQVPAACPPPAASPRTCLERALLPARPLKAPRMGSGAAGAEAVARAQAGGAATRAPHATCASALSALDALFRKIAAPNGNLARTVCASMRALLLNTPRTRMGNFGRCLRSWASTAKAWQKRQWKRRRLASPLQERCHAGEWQQQTHRRASEMSVTLTAKTPRYGNRTAHARCACVCTQAGLATLHLLVVCFSHPHTMAPAGVGTPARRSASRSGFTSVDKNTTKRGTHSSVARQGPNERAKTDDERGAETARRRQMRGSLNAQGSSLDQARTGGRSRT